ncbi:MAG: hypothetical protein GY811_01910 [Myxococcales bacterium]|nr:hypothetical protein [Myxococcales bacterium]
MISIAVVPTRAGGGYANTTTTTTTTTAICAVRAIGAFIAVGRFVALAVICVLTRVGTATTTTTTATTTTTTGADFADDIDVTTWGYFAIGQVKSLAYAGIAASGMAVALVYVRHESSNNDNPRYHTLGPGLCARLRRRLGRWGADSGGDVGGDTEGTELPNQLTAGEWDDNEYFDFFLASIGGLFAEDHEVASVDLGGRVVITLSDDTGSPVSNATIEVFDESTTFLTAPTGADGRLLYLPRLDGSPDDGANLQHEARACSSALAVRDLAMASNLADSGLSPLVAIAVTSGDLWLPMIGDNRQRVVAFTGPCGRVSAELQSLAGPKEILIDTATADSIGALAKLVSRRPGVSALVEMSAPTTQYKREIRESLEEVEDVEDVEDAIAILETLVVPPLAKRLRYVPNDWRTEAELRQVVLVLTEMRGVRISNLKLIDRLSEIFIGVQRDAGGLVLSLQSTVEGHQVLTVYGLQSPFENDEERAVLASHQMMLDMQEVAQTRGVETELRSVVHRGQVHFGAFGTEDCYAMSVVGLPFSETEIMLQGAQGGELVASTAVLERLGSGFVAREIADPVQAATGLSVGLHAIDEISHSKSRYLRVRGEAREFAGHGTMMRDLRSIVDDAFHGTTALVGLRGRRAVASRIS